MFTVSVDYGHRTLTFGPFATAARASGWGFTRYGANTGYGMPRWRVAPLRSPRKDTAR